MLYDMSRQVGVLSVFPRELSYVVAPDRSPHLSALLRGYPADTTIIFQRLKDASVDRIVETDAACLYCTQKALGTYIGSYGLMCHASGATLI
jgi:hypothetical protein